MGKKLKECQDYKTMSYQYLGDYIEGDKVWYQPLNGNAQLGPAAVLCQRGSSVWLHTHGDIKHVAVCCVKLYELIERGEMKEKESNRKKQAMADMNFCTIDGDVAFYYFHEDGHLQGAILTHVDDFHLTGIDNLIKKIPSQV